YFGAYPRALNLPGEPSFQAKPNTPTVNGFTDDLLFRNPNAVNPIRLGPAEMVECSQNHAYTAEQRSANLGAMDKFVENDGAKGTQAGPLTCDPNMVMGYFDGNTVTALWNYAQHYALSDNSFATNWGSSAVGANGLDNADYIPHHQPFQYYASTANPHHVAPSSIEAIGTDNDGANHQYDLDQDFWAAAELGRLPAVSFVKPAAFQEGHNRYSDSLNEQEFLVSTINRLQALPEWRDMAILIVYDDSDGLYDHVLPPLANASNTTADALTGPGACGTSQPGAYQGRCGYG